MTQRKHRIWKKPHRRRKKPNDLGHVHRTAAAEREQTVASMLIVKRRARFHVGLDGVGVHAIENLKRRVAIREPRQRLFHNTRLPQTGVGDEH